ncbi:MAG: ThuA domain-containing protein [Balneolaceae bacterium]
MKETTPVRFAFLKSQTKVITMFSYRTLQTSASSLFLMLVSTLLFMGTSCAQQERHVLFIAGAPSHGFGNHEHLGGSTLLAHTIEDADINVRTTVVSGWPEDSTIFDDVDAIVIYANGGGGHPVMGHLEEFDELMNRGVGFAAIHYGVEVPPGEPGDYFIDWMGGYFETHWSVNPFWTADFDSYPDHPIVNGVEPFQIRDEWYYHMRFQDSMEGVTPILTDLPPEESLSRNDGPHSNNPDVREAVLDSEEPQHVAWAYERPNGGRGFGFTGGHYHWNWGADSFRRLVANAIIWTAGADVPGNGVAIQPITVEELSTMTDDPVPEDWDPEPIQQRIDEANN